MQTGLRLVLAFAFFVILGIQRGVSVERGSNEALLKLKTDIGQAIDKLSDAYKVLETWNLEDIPQLNKKEVSPIAGLVNDETKKDEKIVKENNQRIAELLEKVESQTDMSHSNQRDAKEISKELKEIRSLAKLNSQQAYHLKVLLLNRKIHKKESDTDGHHGKSQKVRDIEFYLESIIPHIALDVKLGEKEIFQFLLVTMDNLAEYLGWTATEKRHVLLDVSSHCLSALRWYYEKTHGMTHVTPLNEGDVVKEMAIQLEMQEMNIATVKILAKAVTTSLQGLRNSPGGEHAKNEMNIWSKILSHVATHGRLKKYL